LRSGLNGRLTDGVFNGQLPRRTNAGVGDHGVTFGFN
jgi:hypothetical protein